MRTFVLHFTWSQQLLHCESPLAATVRSHCNPGSYRFANRSTVTSAESMDDSDKDTVHSLAFPDTEDGVGLAAPSLLAATEISELQELKVVELELLDQANPEVLNRWIGDAISNPSQNDIP